MRRAYCTVKAKASVEPYVFVQFRSVVERFEEVWIIDVDLVQLEECEGDAFDTEDKVPPMD